MAAKQFEAIAKKLVILANIIFVGAGIALIVVGADADPIPQYDAGIDFGIGFAVLGGTLVGCAVLGVLAAVTGKRGLLTAYNIVLSLIVFVQIALASVFFSAFQENIREEIVGRVQAQVYQSYRDAPDVGTRDDRLTRFSNELQCCGWSFEIDVEEPAPGINAVQGFFNLMESCNGTLPGPPGAPDSFAHLCQINPNIPDDPLDVCPCVEPTRTRLDDVMYTMAAVAMGTAVFELVVLFLTCGMAWVFHVKIEQDPTNVSYHR